MTEVVLVCGREGEFRRVSASGHASFAARGKDIVCAAETVLLRTALEVLQKSPELEVSFDAGKRGHLSFQASGNSRERLCCVADFLREGLGELSKEYPGNISFREESEN